MPDPGLGRTPWSPSSSCPAGLFPPPHWNKEIWRERSLNNVGLTWEDGVLTQWSQVCYFCTPAGCWSADIGSSGLYTRGDKRSSHWHQFSTLKQKHRVNVLLHLWLVVILSALIVQFLFSLFPSSNLFSVETQWHPVGPGPAATKIKCQETVGWGRGEGGGGLISPSVNI